MARSEKWRTKFVLAMNLHIPLFAEAIDTLNMFQRQFISWCLFYYNISQMDEPPNINVIEDDRMLDAFLKARQLQIQKEKIKMAAESKKRGNSSAHEVFK